MSDKVLDIEALRTQSGWQFVSKYKIKAFKRCLQFSVLRSSKNKTKQNKQCGFIYFSITIFRSFKRLSSV